MRSDYVEREALVLLFSAMTRENALAVRVSLLTGLRIGDVLALRPSDVSDDGTISIVCQKTGKPFSGNVDAKTLRELRASSNSRWVFPSPVDGNKHRTRQAVWRNIKNAVARCGMRRNITPHTARKVYAVETFKKRGLNAVQTELQHDRVTTSMLYAFADAITAEASRDETGTASGSAVASAFCRGLVLALGGEARILTAVETALAEARNANGRS